MLRTPIIGVVSRLTSPRIDLCEFERPVDVSVRQGLIRLSSIRPLAADFVTMIALSVHSIPAVFNSAGGPLVSIMLMRL